MQPKFSEIWGQLERANKHLFLGQTRLVIIQKNKFQTKHGNLDAINVYTQVDTTFHKHKTWDVTHN